MKKNSNKNKFSIIFTADEIRKMNLKKHNYYYIISNIEKKQKNSNQKLH